MRGGLAGGVGHLGQLLIEQVCDAGFTECVEGHQQKHLEQLTHASIRKRCRPQYSAHNNTSVLDKTAVMWKPVFAKTVLLGCGEAAPSQLGHRMMHNS